TEIFKVPTTPHDLTVGLFQALKNISEHRGVSLEELLLQTASIKFATTIGTNTIIQKSGPKIGLVLTGGAEDEIIGEDNANLMDFISDATLTTVAEAVDSEGHVHQIPDEQEVIEKIEYLLDNGARRIVISFRNADVNPSNEKRIKSIVEKNYPKHSLGWVPLLLSTQVTTRQGYMERTNTAVINSYLHSDMARFLYKAQDQLARERFRYPLLIGHSGGGISRVAKTQAINTYNSGPAAGVFSGYALSVFYPDIKNFITADLGGTSLDLGFISGGGFSHDFNIEIGGVPCHVYMVEVANQGIGGGSIAAIAEERIKVGPRSAGAAPGPACFDLGGIEPTVTDSDVILGYIDPEYFLGGQFKLSPEKALQAISDFVADPLGKTVEEAAEHIRNQAAREMADILNTCAPKMHGIQPMDCALVAFGGAGPTHCCSFADLCGMKTIIIPHLASAFSAFGLSLMDVLHVYEKNWATPAGIKDLVEGAEYLTERALSDMRGEGYQYSDVDMILQLVGREEKGRFTLQVRGKDPGEWKNMVKESISANHIPDDVRSLLLHVMGHTASPEISPIPMGSVDPKEAFLRMRDVYFKGEKSDIPVYSRAKLIPGNEVTGPAIVEAPDTTYVIEKSWRLAIDAYDNAIVTKA
ncbi:MAG: hydantoinase/oxoprolinase family protein, partial [Deltaproteobacteria bacterium]|nr:hydantoinase/oxoprolinase family protein [Deltaproteobacteria bacterium]